MGAIMANGSAPAKPAGKRRSGDAFADVFAGRSRVSCYVFDTSLWPRDRLLEKKQSFARPIASN